MKASQDAVWDKLADVEAWPSWAPSESKYRVLSHPIVEREGNNVVVCDEEEQAWFVKSHHRDRYTLTPKEKLTEVIVLGDFQGGIELRLSKGPGGTLVQVYADISPKKPLARFLGFFIGSRLLTKFWIELLEQLEKSASEEAASGSKHLRQG